MNDIAKVCLVSIISLGIFIAIVILGSINLNNRPVKITTQSQVIAAVTDEKSEDAKSINDEIIKTDNMQTIQPGGCKSPLVFPTSGGRYIIPLTNINAINTYESTSGTNTILIYINDQKLIFDLSGQNSLHIVDNLISKICYN